MGPMGAFEQPVGSLGLVSLEPLVASLAADIVASAEFGVGEEARGGLEDESLAFVHGIGLQPWHGQLQEKRGRKPERNPLDEKVRKLERRNARLENELRKAHLIIDVQGKVAGLLGISLDDGTNS